MPAAGQYQGSQAFNHINPSMKESVNPNTGSLFFSVPVVKLQGKRSSIDLTVNLFYSAGFRGTFGLPSNWGLDLPYVLDDKSVTANGRTYAIDPEWTDVRGHESGLRYTNNHGIKFRKVVPPEPLPSGKQGEYGYTLKHVDGSVDYFDPLGKPTEHHDIYGNFIHYNYVTGDQDGVDSPELRIGQITDSWGQEIQFFYDQGSEIRIRSPDENETLIQFSSTNVYTITDPADNKTRLDYAPFNDGAEVLSSINYPSGLISRYDYAPIQYLDDKGNPGYMPAVEDFRSIDAAKTVYQHTRYIYGRESGATYTGAAIGCRMGGSTDSLMDNDDRALEYTYDVETLSLDLDEKPIAQVRTWYNNLHLPTEETRFLRNERGSFVEATKTKLTYNADKEKRARITSYNLPIRTETFSNTSPNSKPTWHPLTRSDAEYNEYGNSVGTSEWLCERNGDYTKQSSVRTDYVTTEKRVQLPAKSWNTDAVARTIEYKEHKPTQDGRSIASAITWFQEGLEPTAKLQPWKQKALEYDTAGRLTSTTTSWSDEVRLPEGFLKSITTKTEYGAISNGILTKTEIDARGNRTMIKKDLRQVNGPDIQKTHSLGQVESFQYDSIGRLIKHINPLGHQTVTSYMAGSTGTSKTITSPLKYSTRTAYDVLGREIQVSDNGDPTSPFTDQPTRVLSRKLYNTMGFVKESIDRLGLSTKFTYDALNRPLTEVDPHGNIITYKHDDGGFAVTETLNNELRKVTELDVLSRPVRETSYADVNDKSTEFTEFCTVYDTQYNGNGKIIQKSSSQKRTLSSSSTDVTVLLETENTTYGPDQTVRSKAVTGITERGKDTVTRQYILDLFDNNATYTKTTSYANGKTFTHQGPVRLYNECNQLASYLHQEGKEERYKYDANGGLQQTTRFDGTQVTYTRDDAGQAINVAYPSGAFTENTFNADGKVVQVREGTEVVQYSLCLDGTLTGVAYSDGRTQSLTLDKFSRMVKETDAFGISKETEYSDTGLVTRRLCQGDTVTYAYGTANHTHGQYLSSTFSGSNSYQSTIAYDGFGRQCQNIITDSASTVLLDTRYAIDAQGKIKSVKSASAIFAEHNNKRDFLYDGIGQVIQEAHESDSPSVTRSVTAYTYDGNANVLSVDENSQVVSMTYNKLDQRIDDGFVYDTNGRLTQDNEGRRYSFDEHDRLISVSASTDTSTEFGYRSNDRLAHRRKGETDIDTFYHHASKVNAVHTTRKEGKPQDTKTSLLSDSDSLLAGYTDGQPSSQFLQQLSSTAVVMSPEGHVSGAYGAYGVSKATSSPSKSIASSFGFTQAFTDQKSGLVYLGSRFYNPKQMSFLSMDTYHTENRYAYCEGDPINRIDPTGHAWLDWIATGASVAVALGVSIAITGATGGLGCPLLFAVIGGAAGGALGNATSLAINQLGGKDVSLSDYGWSMASGAIIGGLSAGLGHSAKYAAGDSFVKAVLTGAGVGAVGGGLKETAVMLHRDEDFDWSRVVTGAMKGAVTGAAAGYWGRRAYIREQMYKYTPPEMVGAATVTDQELFMWPDMAL